MTPTVVRNILVVSYYYPPDRSVGSHRWAAMAAHLRLLGHQVRVVTTSAFGRLPDDGGDVVRTGDLQVSPTLRRLLRRPPRASGAALLPVSTPVPGYLANGLVPDALAATWIPFALAAVRRELRAEKFDCLVTNGTPHSTHLIGLLLGDRRPAWIADFEDGWRLEPLRNEWPTLLQDRIDADLERRVARKSDLIVGVSSPIAADFSTRLRANTRHVPLGWDPRIEPRGTDTAILEPDRFNLVHAGNLTVPHRRDPQPLFDALRALALAQPAAARRLRLVLVGPMSEVERRTIANLGLEQMILCVGQLDFAEVIALERAADALLLLATGDHTSYVPGKLYEYLFAGRPILAISDDNAAAQVVKETGTGLVVSPSDTAGVVEALVRALGGGLQAFFSPRGLEKYAFPAPAIAFEDAIEAALKQRARHRSLSAVGRG